MLSPRTYTYRGQGQINVEAYRNHTHTHPAKLVFALLASHVTGRSSQPPEPYERMEKDLLATTILLDSTLTFATFLGIAFDPVCRFAIIAALLQPHLCDST
jgi:hypothetical protein